MGRFTWKVLNVKNEKQVMIISEYILCKAGTNIRPHMAHMKQVKQMLIKRVVAPNPRKETLQDLKSLINGHHI